MKPEHWNSQEKFSIANLWSLDLQERFQRFCCLQNACIILAMPRNIFDTGLTHFSFKILSQASREVQ